MSANNPPLDLNALRRPPAEAHGQPPALGGLWEASLDRRELLKFAAASLALTGGCGRQPPEEIVPYVQQPEGVVPGRPRYYATALTLAGYARGVLVETHEGRPTKIEGNPQHPASLGATDVWAQAACLELYDPDRAQTLTLERRPSSWSRLLAELVQRRQDWRENGGRGLALLTPTVTSPSLLGQLRGLLDQYPEARWYRHDPLARDNVYQGMLLVYGQALEPVYRFDQARVVLSLDSDFLYGLPGSLRYARDFTDQRRPWRDPATLNRLYALESTPTLSGAMADHRRRLRASAMEPFARALARRLGLDVAAPDGPPPLGAGFLEALARDLEAHPGAALVAPGEHLPPAVHALVQAINHRLGGVGRTVEPGEPVAAGAGETGADLPALTAALERDQVQSLVILGGDPVYTAGADMDLAAALGRLPFSLYWGLYANATARSCRWQLPAAHELESWGDARAYDGLVSLRQPLLRPLFGGRADHELLAALGGEYEQSDQQIVQAHWRRQHPQDFDAFWQRSLHDGIVEGSRPPLPTLGAPDLAGLPPPTPSGDGLELRLAPDPCILDGRYGHLGWLQELPKPLTSLVWGNGALLSPAEAGRLGVSHGGILRLRLRGRELEAPAYILPGHAEGVVTLYLGYGQQGAAPLGVDGYRLRFAETPWFSDGLELTAPAPPVAQAGLLRISKPAPDGGMVQIQRHFRMEGRPVVRHGELGEFLRNPDFLHDQEHEKPPEHSLYPAWDKAGDYAWGMAIDLNACIGCNACTIACQAENNIPTVGREEVAKGHEMHWIRVDTYYEGPAADPRTFFQPVPCMHCEKAPCEYVCPVMATVHDAEGLNVQVYNRCIGTRDCSQNCPYKVRRFNWRDYNYGSGPASQAPLHNPDVTVRSRGVMEKCTYCVQRISQTRIQARKEHRTIRADEVQTACQQVCPTQAIVFGDLNNPESQVNRLKHSPLDYALLAELNTRPRTTYLARLRNPNPALAGEEPDGG